VGNKQGESWTYVIIIIVLAFLFVLVLPVIGFMYMEVHRDRILMDANVKRIEKLKKEMGQQKEKSE